jgi:hypothetical protein
MRGSQEASSAHTTWFRKPSMPCRAPTDDRYRYRLQNSVSSKPCWGSKGNITGGIGKEWVGWGASQEPLNALKAPKGRLKYGTWSKKSIE